MPSSCKSITGATFCSLQIKQLKQIAKSFSSRSPAKTITAYTLVNFRNASDVFALRNLLFYPARSPIEREILTGNILHFSHDNDLCESRCLLIIYARCYSVNAGIINRV